MAGGAVIAGLKNWIKTSETKVIVIASATLRPEFSAQVNRLRLAMIGHSPPVVMSVTTGG